MELGLAGLVLTAFILGWESHYWIERKIRGRTKPSPEGNDNPCDHGGYQPPF